MKALSSRRNDSSTAFLILWWVVQFWPSVRSATRSWPLSSMSITAMTASLTWGSALRGVISARRSKASSMVFCRSCMVFSLKMSEGIGVRGKGSGVNRDALRRFDAGVQAVDQRDADEALARVDGGGVAREVAAGQHGDVLLFKEAARERGIVAARHARPQGEGGVGRVEGQHVLQQRHYGGEFLGVLAAVFDHVRLVVPSRDAGGLHRRAHRAAVVGAVKQEFLHHLGVARHHAVAQAGHVVALRERV